MKKQNINAVVQQQEADNMLGELLLKAYNLKELYTDMVDVSDDEVIVRYRGLTDREREKLKAITNCKK